MRFKFVDGLRGVAALSVCLFHIGRDFLHIGFLHYGGLGVTVFFVLSGFVISHSLVNKQITPKYFASFAIKRSIRLDPAYWFAILLAILVLWIPSRLLDYKVSLPSFGDILANMFYLQGILGVGNINSVFWTLCYEIQFYLVFCGLLLGSGYILGLKSTGNRNIALFSSLIGVSLLWPLCDLGNPYPGAFLNLWYLFLLGVFARWSIDSHLALAVFYLVNATLLIMSVVKGNATFLVASLTALSLFVALRRQKMGSWLSWRWIQYIGMISYSLYLVHDIIGLYVRDTGLHLTRKIFGISSLAMNYLWCFIALFVSILVAHIVFKLIEQPSHRLSKQLDINNLLKVNK